METNLSKSNDFYAHRLAGIHMAAHDRLRAEAHLRRAEALADLFLAAVHWVQGLVKTVDARDVRHPGGHPTPTGA